MKVLGIDTAMWTGSVAIIYDDHLCGMVGINAAASHAERLMSCIDFLFKNLGMQENELDGLAVSAGPGSFTGLRIGIGTVKGFSLALKKPAVGISTLKAMARSVPAGMLLCPLIDAGRGEVYGCCYRREGEKLLELCGETLDDPLRFLGKIDAHEVCVFGTGAEKFRHEIERTYSDRVRIVEFNHFLAPSVAMLGSDLIREGNIGSLKPNYIRKPDAELQTERRTRKS